MKNINFFSGDLVSYWNFWILEFEPPGVVPPEITTNNLFTWDDVQMAQSRYRSEKEQKGVIIMTTNNKFFNAANFCAAAATPSTLFADTCFMAGEALTKVSKVIAGEEGWVKVPGHKYADKHATGVVFDFDFDAAVAAADKKVGKAEKKAEEKKDHSDMVDWNKGHWVPSVKAEAKAKEAGYSQAYLPQIYKCANWIIRISKEGMDKAYVVESTGEAHTYAGWALKALLGHIAFMSKTVKDANKRAAEYWALACKHSRVASDKLPSLDDIKTMAAKEQEMSAPSESKAKEEKGTKEVKEEKEEKRDGRAPKTMPKTTKKIKVLDLVHKVVGEPRLRRGNAYLVAEKAKACFEANKLTEEEFYAVIDACIAKDGGNAEDFYALADKN